MHNYLPSESGGQEEDYVITGEMKLKDSKKKKDNFLKVKKGEVPNSYTNVFFFNHIKFPRFILPETKE